MRPIDPAVHEEFLVGRDLIKQADDVIHRCLVAVLVSVVLLKERPPDKLAVPTIGCRFVAVCQLLGRERTLGELILYFGEVRVPAFNIVGKVVEELTPATAGVAVVAEVSGESHDVGHRLVPFLSIAINTAAPWRDAGEYRCAARIA